MPVVIRGLQAAINTLGSKYLGETNDRAFLAMAAVCIAVALLVGAVVSAVILSFADSIFAFCKPPCPLLALLLSC